MAKKPKGAARGEREKAADTFSGFNTLAAGLGDLKAKLAEEERKAAEARAKAKQPPPPPKPTPRQPRATGITRTSDLDDEHAFHRLMSGVTPLGERGSRVPVGATPRVEVAKNKSVDWREKARAEAEAVIDHLHHLVDDTVRFEVSDDGRRVEGRRIDAPPQLVRELRRGNLPIDARLDLHGLVAEAAREKVLEFLRTTRTRGERCVLVIHGKGEHSAAAGGVLRGEISAWLSQGRAREHVAAFATARDEDGGEGAVYVALRR